LKPDHLSDLFGRVNLSARVFHSGDLCRNASFDGVDGCGHLHVLRRGHLKVIGDDGVALDLDEPFLLFYARPVKHVLAIDADSPPDIVCASVEFSGGRTNPIASTLPPFIAVPLKRLSGLAATLACLFEEGFNQRNGTRLILDRLCEILVIQLLRVAIEDGEIKSGVLAGLMDPRISRAIMAIHGDPNQPWGLHKLAAMCNVSRSRFAVLFKRRVGMTVGEYLTNWRIYTAQERLRTGKSVKLVAQDVGYGSQSAFTRAFVGRIGMSPRAWMKLHCG